MIPMSERVDARYSFDERSVSRATSSTRVVGRKGVHTSFD